MSKNWGPLKGKVQRKICGPTREKEGWQIKYNYELYDLHNSFGDSEDCQIGEAQVARTPNQSK
jgi:hypothetical protein